MFQVYAFPSRAPLLIGDAAHPDEAVDLALSTACLHGFAVVSSGAGAAVCIVDRSTGELITTGHNESIGAAFALVIQEQPGVPS